MIVKDNDSFFLIKESTVGQLQIGMDIQKIKEIYKGYEFKEESASNYGIDGEGKGTLITKNNEYYLFYYAFEGENTLAGIICLNPKYHSKTGIRVGMTIRELKKIYPDCVVRINEEFDSEYIFIEEEKLFIEPTSETGEKIGNYDSDSESITHETKSMNPDGTIFLMIIK